MALLAPFLSAALMFRFGGFAKPAKNDSRAGQPPNKPRKPKQQNVFDRMAGDEDSAYDERVRGMVDFLAPDDRSHNTNEKQDE